ncbi:putative type IX secretion system sortase PorU2 [Membranihabitans marinus]|uniref:putative type IX secretion system sortase PorU2 n=1 Tax=Membranihabitans marinus TaxID=1227546 RepID=UPI001F00CACA|nr:C25 family cysteine peptidase [Membranihabitans marinus]
MKIKNFFGIAMFLFAVVYGNAQIVSPGQQTLYGNEWIDYDQTYYRIPVGEDGWKKISYEALSNLGIEEDELLSQNVRLHHNGEEVPVFISSDGGLNPGDYILFYGQQNRGYNEEFMFEDVSTELLNPEYSLFSDTSVYFLSFESQGIGRRYSISELNGGMERSRVNVISTTVFSDRHYTEAYSGVFEPDFIDLEGYASIFRKDNSVNVSIPVSNISSDSVRIEIGTAGDIRTSVYDVYLQDKWVTKVENNRPQQVKKVNLTLSASELTSTTKLRLLCELSTERAGFSYFKAHYEMDSEKYSSSQHQVFSLGDIAGLQDLTFGMEYADELLFDYVNGRAYRGRISDDIVVFTVDNQPNAVYGFGNHAVTTESIQPINFENYLIEDFDYLIITNSVLREETSGGDAVQAYADYRSSTIGGGYKVLIADIDQLRDQFIYGIEGNPYAIRNFIQSISNNNLPLRFVNIIGKGVTYSYARKTSEYKEVKNTVHFVPTFGYYGSDNLLVSDRFNPIPLYAVGRIPVVSPDEILTYLEKIKQYESVVNHPENIEDRRWLKKIFHFNGGDRGIYATIARTMDTVGEKIEQDSFAANVVSYYKSSFGTDESPEQEEIYEQINGGGALISFLGHSASSALDFDIDNIGEYENQGKLPIFVALGCSSGNIFLKTKNLSELFVLTPDIGSIAFLSTASSEYLHTLQNFANVFYDEFGGNMYGQSLGEILATTHSKLGLSHSHLISVFTFCGDPALKSYHATGPDYAFNENSASIEPEIPSLLDEKIELTISVQNLGINRNDSIGMAVEVQLPNGQRIVVDTVKFVADGYDNYVTIDIPVLDNMEGRNLVFLTLDPNKEIAEFPSIGGEQNNVLYVENKLGYEIYVRNSALQLVYPYHESIVPTTGPSFVFFNGNIGQSEVNYLLEIDSIPTFNSSFKKSIEKSSDLATVSFDNPLTFEENKVYYWRVSGVSDSLFSATHSFVCINGQTGWNQSHFGQFAEDSLFQMTIDNEGFHFETIKNELYLIHGPFKADATYNAEISRTYSRMIGPGINVSIFRPSINDFVENPHPGLYNSYHPLESDGILKTFCFIVSEEDQRSSLIDLIKTESQPGDLVLVWNSTEGDSPQGNTWALDSVNHQGVNLFNFFESKGSNLIRELEKDDRKTFTFMYREGGEVLYEGLLNAGEAFNDILIFEAPHTDASMSSSYVSYLDNITEISLQNTNGEESDLVKYTGVIEVRDGQPQSLNYENSTTLNQLEYENIDRFRWAAEISDFALRSIPSIQHWRVRGDYKIDLSVSNVDKTPLYSEEALAKRKLYVAYQLIGIEDVEADSIEIGYEIITQSYHWEQTLVLSTDELSPYRAFEIDLASEINSDFIFKIVVDPSNKIDEAVEYNNSILTVVKLNKDILAPKIEVTFDNQYILNRDIVSPKTVIVAEIAEIGENNLGQPLAFDFSIQYPNGSQVNILESDPKLDVDYLDDRVVLKYYSEFSEDGIYSLQLRARDEYNNSEDADYSIEFEIINESRISRFLPYPNPFVNSMRFAYTLTGTVEPEYFSILIYTPSGRLVKEITKQEFGTMNIGSHLSNYVWDGKDNYNQNLAPGIYLYKVIVRDMENSNFTEHQISEVDQYFKDNIGKIVKLR